MLQSSAYRQKRCPRRSSSLSRSSSTRLLKRGESGPPCGVPSSTGPTKPSSITPDLRNARMSLRGWIASPGLTHAEARSQADIYRERCAAYGRQPNAVALRRDIYVGESSSEAQAVLRHALSRGYRGIPAE